MKSDAAALRAGLPFAFRTPEAHFVLDMARQLPGGIPAHLRVNKVYYNRDVTAITREWDDVKEFGDGAAEEWRKGLPTKGKDRMTDASRWEKWESHLRLGSGLLSALREYNSAFSPRPSATNETNTAGLSGISNSMAMNGKYCCYVNLSCLASTSLMQ